MFTAFSFLLTLHSLLRWLVLISLLYAIYRAFKGMRSKSVFSKTDNAVRHWTATIAHIQLTVGFILYFKSILVNSFWKNTGAAGYDGLFFGLIHLLLMLAAITILTIGSAITKRKSEDQEKFRTMFIWFIIALLIIFIAIPWPFSPLANRPLIRPL